MAKKVEGGYMCTICEQIYPDTMKADACRNSHEIVYVPMTHTELNRLVNGLFLGDLSIIPESLFETLRKVQRNLVTRRGI